MQSTTSFLQCRESRSINNNISFYIVCIYMLYRMQVIKRSQHIAHAVARFDVEPASAINKGQHHTLKLLVPVYFVLIVMPRLRRGASSPEERDSSPALARQWLNGSPSSRLRSRCALPKRSPGSPSGIASLTPHVTRERLHSKAQHPSPSFRRVARHVLSLRLRSMAQRFAITSSTLTITVPLRYTVIARCGFVYTNRRSSDLRTQTILPPRERGGTLGNRNRAVGTLRMPCATRANRAVGTLARVLPKPRKEASHGREKEPLGAGAPAPH